MARQGSQSQSRRDHKARVVLRGSLLLSLWFFTACVPGPTCAQDQGAESAVGSMSASESLLSETKRISLVSGTSLQIVQANEKMPWVFNIRASDDSDTAETALDPLTLRYSIHRVDLGHRVLSGQREIIATETDQLQTISLDDRAPKVEGVYEVRFQLVRRSDKLWARLRPKEIVLEEVRVPMLVQLSPTEATANPTPWQVIGEIRPSDTAMALGQWLPDSAARLIPGVRHVKGNLQKGEAFGETVSIVQPKSVFQAKLPIMATGYPHRITIRCPHDQAGGLRIDLGQGVDQTQSRLSSVIQSRDASLMNQRTAYHQTGNQHSGNSGAPSDDRWLTRTFLYYPQLDDQIWLTNLNESSSVAFESIEVTAGPATPMNLKPRKTMDGRAMRQVVMSISDLNWTQAWTDDWQAVGESAACKPRAIELHRVWVAAHRAVEQAQQMGASSLAIPLNLDDPTLNDSAIDRENIAMHVFDQFDISIKPSVTFNNNQVGRLEQTAQRFTKFHCFDGVVIAIDQPMDVSKSAIDVLQRVSRSKRLLVRTPSTPLNQKSRERVWSIKGAVLVSNFDCSGSFHPASELSSTGSPGTTGVALVDSTIAYQNPSACLFEMIHRVGPSVVIIGESVARGMVDDRLRRICKSYEALPADSIMEIASLDLGDGTCQVTHAMVQDRVLISLSNQAPWDSIVKLELVGGSNTSSGAESLLSDAVLWERIDDGSFYSTNGSQLSQGLNVPARDTVLLRSRFPVSQSSHSAVDSWRWSAQISGGESVVSQIKKDVTEIVERMGMLSDPDANDQLNNGSFETVGEMGLVGWLHAQHPPGCVMVDSEVASDGSKSVRLKTDRAVSARTWLVSDTITAPASGRLAISMALRGEDLRSETKYNEVDASEGHSSVDASSNQGDQASQAARAGSAVLSVQKMPSEKPHHLRVSLEGTQSGAPIRKSADVEIPRSGTWQPRRIVLEVDSFDPSTTDSLRLTIDSMTPGLIWVDDIRIHDDFSTARERTDLQTQAFLAVEGLQRGNLTPSAKLLVNRWASRLLEESNRAEQQTEMPSLSSESAKSAFGEDVPEVANRNRVWLLERLRF